MPVAERASHDVGASSTSSGSSSPIPPQWVTEAFEAERIPALRESVRGMETKLVDLVFDSLLPGRVMDWLHIPLRCAADLGDLTALKRLLAAGVETQLPPQRVRMAPILHVAAESGSEGVVEELLKAGVDVHETDSGGENQSALHDAAATGSEAGARALVSAGASIDALDSRGWTPLQYACSHGHRGVVVFLLLEGACPRKGCSNDPPLHLAAIYDHPGVIEDLLSIGNVSVWGFDLQGRSGAGGIAWKRCERSRVVAVGCAQID